MEEHEAKALQSVFCQQLQGVPTGISYPHIALRNPIYKTDLAQVSVVSWADVDGITIDPAGKYRYPPWE